MTTSPPASGAGSAPVVVPVVVCECCMQRPASARVVWPDDAVALCGTCLDDARTLGLVIEPTTAHDQAHDDEHASAGASAGDGSAR